jgi:hypothetical protein
MSCLLRNRALEGLERVNRDLIQRLGERCVDQKFATVDQDATIIESRKREAPYTYEGSRGYQPMLAVWAEMDVVLADEFRDGNVPAQMAPLTVAQAAFAALPNTVTSYYYRGDSACHEKKLLRWLLNEKRADGPAGFIGFAISARMSDALHEAIGVVPESGWKAYGAGAGCRSGMRRGGIRFQRGAGAERDETAALRGHPVAETAGRIIC